jgi:hypothetical protein
MVWTMSTGLYGIEWNGLGAIRDHFAGLPSFSVRTGVIGLAGVLMAGSAGWMLLSGQANRIAMSETTPIAVTAVPEPMPELAAIVPPAAAPMSVTEQTSPVEGLRISSQHWRRGGLGSNALVTFTLRNTNRYAVKDIEISCAFSRSDGGHLTDRTRVIHETVRRRSRKAFRQLHIGFVNVNADRARCSLIGASRA